MFKLQNKYSLYIPSTIKLWNISGEEHNKKIESYTRVIARKFKGATITRGVGNWIGNSGFVTEENVAIISAFSEDDELEFMVSLAEILKEEMKQECVSLEVNGVLYLI